MKNYEALLENAYQEELRWNECLGKRLEFIGSTIFDFTTYDRGMDERLALKMVEVIECIINRTNFVYQQNNYENYIIMVNMPFLRDKLEWGGSIRGAWIDNFKKYKIAGIEINEQELETFLVQLVRWHRNSLNDIKENL
jgi:hypothetical protein